MLNDEQQIFDQINKADSILITFREKFNEDSLASALAVALFLKKLEKKVTIAAAHFNVPRHLAFLPGLELVQPQLAAQNQFIVSVGTSNATPKDVSYQMHDGTLEFIITPQQGQFLPTDVTARALDGSFDVVLVIDTSDLASLGDVYASNTELFFKTPAINIDHHPRNEEFGQINYVKITALATAEVVFELLHTYSAEMIDGDIATCLLAGIIANSRSFKVGSLTPNALTVASRLVNLGARREEIVQHLYQNRSINTLRLWGRVLAKLQYALDGRLMWSVLNAADFGKTSSTPADLDGVIEDLIVNIPDAQVIVLIAENPAGKNAIHVYAFKNVDARDLTRDFGAGSGAKEYVVMESDKPINELEQKVIEHVKQKLAKLPV